MALGQKRAPAINEVSTGPSRRPTQDNYRKSLEAIRERTAYHGPVCVRRPHIAPDESSAC